MSSAIEVVVTGLMASPVFAYAGKFGLKHLEKTLLEWIKAGPEPAAISKAIAANYEEWIVLLDHWVAYLYEQQAKRAEDVDALRERVDAQALHEDTRRMLATFAFEAMREALPERRELLGAAAAAMTLSDMPLEDKARCERTLRQLDLRHVLQLRALSLVASRHTGGHEQASIDNVRYAKWMHLPDREVLSAAGCVHLTASREFVSEYSAAAAALRLTGTAKTLLDLLRDYLKTKALPFVPPGRESADGSRSREEALAFATAQVPGLPTLLSRVVRGRHFRYHFPDWARGGKPLASADPQAPAFIHVERVPRDEAERMAALRPYQSIRHEDDRRRGRLTEIGIAAREHDRAWFLDVHGPHDVMRWLADELDAEWAEWRAQ